MNTKKMIRNHGLHGYRNSGMKIRIATSGRFLPTQYRGFCHFEPRKLSGSRMELLGKRDIDGKAEG